MLRVHALKHVMSSYILKNINSNIFVLFVSAANDRKKGTFKDAIIADKNLIFFCCSFTFTITMYSDVFHRD